MKTLNAICAATLLALSLGVSVYAGDQHTPGSPIPAPTPNALVNCGPPAGSLAADGDIDSLNLADILWALGFELLR